MFPLIASVVAGLAVAAGIIVLVARRTRATTTTSHTTPLGWTSFGLGVATAVLLAIARIFRPPDIVSEAEGAARAGRFDPESFSLIALGTGIAALVTAAIAATRGDRRWPTWCGLALGAVAVGIWVGVIIYIMFNPY